MWSVMTPGDARRQSERPLTRLVNAFDDTGKKKITKKQETATTTIQIEKRPTLLREYRAT